MPKPRTNRALPTPSLDLLQATLFYLMNRYIKLPQETVAKAIVDHLEQLNEHPEITLCPAQREVYARLANDWRWRLSIERAPLH